MKSTIAKASYPDLFSRPSAHKFGDSWDTVAVARIIRENSKNGKSPSFLFLGHTETGLLREHLAQAFGEEAVSTLNETYYMGLKIITVDAECYISTGGSKAQSTNQAPTFSIAS
ncbi:MAG: hypothetical protein ACSHX7_14285 [Luteolibacter sp.]